MKWMARCGMVLAMTAVCVAAEAPGFKVTRKYPLPGDGGFDYVVFDGSASRVYVSHGTEVDVVDADSGKILGTVEHTPGVHGIAIVPALHRGFTSNGGDATVSVFDTVTLKTLKTINVSADPDFIFYDPTSGRVLVCHGDGAVITAIDPEGETVIGTIDLGGGAEAAVVNGRGAGFVNLEDAALIVGFDPRSLAVTDKWPITGCQTPTGLAMDTANNRLFIGCRSRVLAVMDASNGHVITTLAIGDHVDAVAYDAGSGLIFASNGDGTVSVIRQKSADVYESAGAIQTQPSAKTMALDPKAKRLFLSAVEQETVPAANGQRARTRAKSGTFTLFVVERQ